MTGTRGRSTCSFASSPLNAFPVCPGRRVGGIFLQAAVRPVSNPGYAILTQSKRFPLVSERSFYPLADLAVPAAPDCSPAAVNDLEDGQWVLKPALGREGRDVCIRGVTDPNAWRRIVRTVRDRPDAWPAQRRFDVVPLPTPEGLLYPCLGVYVIDGEVAGCYGRMGTQPIVDNRCHEVAVLVRSEESF